MTETLMKRLIENLKAKRKLNIHIKLESQKLKIESKNKKITKVIHKYK